MTAPQYDDSNVFAKILRGMISMIASVCSSS